MACTGSAFAPLLGCCGGGVPYFVAVHLARAFTTQDRSAENILQLVRLVSSDCIEKPFPEDSPNALNYTYKYVWNGSDYVLEFNRPTLCSAAGSGPVPPARAIFQNNTAEVFVVAVKIKAMGPSATVCSRHGFRRFTASEGNVFRPVYRCEPSLLFGEPDQSDITQAVNSAGLVILPSDLGEYSALIGDLPVTWVAGIETLLTVTPDGSLPAPCNPAP